VLQKFILSELPIYDVALAKLQIAFVLFLPARLSVTLGLLIAFAYGFMADILLHPIGLNAFACTLLFGFRTIWLRVIVQDARKEDEPISLQQEAQSFAWLLIYILPSIFVFETAYAILNQLAFSGWLVLSVFASTLYSGLVCLLVALLVFRKSP
jgi:hypothetical protein